MWVPAQAKREERFSIPGRRKDCATSSIQRRGGICSRQNARQHAPRRQPKGWLRLNGVTRNNLDRLDASFPLGVMTAVTGVSGSGKSTLVSQALVELVAERLGQNIAREEEESDNLEDRPVVTLSGRITDGMQHIRRLVVVDQKPIGRTPRSNMATYTGLFDHVRRLFASTKLARSRKYDAGRFSFNVAEGPLRDLFRRRICLCRVAVPSQRVQSMSNVPWRTVQ